ncbi:glycan-binding surface protein [Pedobacter zeae]|uniref:Surface glycan-binding protein B xyloglucan binding domain-containing protein n=2 Tax=Pedobacter zeae TaxID=1737356 RepID=A0A7W6K9S3_9SPHI|nr:glycan-binding surface protein [Pedobacter zeae]MBB4106760.1 hypothetical protein [Pedobacter zeae]
MKKIIYQIFSLLALCLMVAALLPACKKDAKDKGAPVITNIRSYVASPNDTVLKSAVANGQYVVITGENLRYATRISFNGVDATFNTALFASNSAVVQIPAMEYSKLDTAKLYTVDYVTTSGSTTFSFKLGPAAPKVTGVSNLYANPGDSVYVSGTDFFFVKRFSYRGTPIQSFKLDPLGTSIGFIMPATTSNDIISVSTKSGEVNFKIVATPIIASVSNENANPGDSVYIYGTYLKNIQTLTFAGTAITSFKSAANGSSVGFILPALTQRGPVSITTSFGSASTIYNVNDTETGSISNWDSNFNWQYWGAGKQTQGDPHFPGNSSTYMAMDISGLSAGDGMPWSTNIPMNGAQWVPAASITDSVSHWAFKFETNIPRAWNGTTVNIVTGVGGFIARWEPWQKTATTTAPYTTKGWVTVTIPLTAFRASDPTLGEGKGASIATIADLTGSSGNTSCILYIHNYGTAAGSFYGAFDNLRVVRIK